MIQDYNFEAKLSPPKNECILVDAAQLDAFELGGHPRFNSMLGWGRSRAGYVTAYVCRSIKRGKSLEKYTAYPHSCHTPRASGGVGGIEGAVDC